MDYWLSDIATLLAEMRQNGNGRTASRRLREDRPPEARRLNENSYVRASRTHPLLAGHNVSRDGTEVRSLGARI